MVNNYANKNTSKLLVAVLAMLMIVAGAAVVLSEEASAAPVVDSSNNTTATVSTYEDFKAVLTDNEYSAVTNVNLTGDIVITENLTIPKAVTIDGAKSGEQTGNYKISFQLDSNDGEAAISLNANTGVTFKNIDFVDDNSTRDVAYLINTNASTVVFTGCDFDCEVAQLGNLSGANSATFTNCAFNGNKVAINYVSSNNSTTSFVGCTDVALNVMTNGNDVAFTIGGANDSTNIKIDDPATISKLILGWDYGNGYNGGAPATQIKTPMTVADIVTGSDTANPTSGQTGDNAKKPTLAADSGIDFNVTGNTDIDYTIGGKTVYNGDITKDITGNEIIFGNAHIALDVEITASKVTVIGNTVNEGTINANEWGFVVDGGKFVNEGTVNVINNKDGTSNTGNATLNIYTGDVENFGTVNVQTVNVGTQGVGNLENSGTVNIAVSGTVGEGSTISNSGAFAATGSNVAITGDGTFENLTGGVVGFPVNTKFVTGVTYDVTLGQDIIQSVTYGSLQNVIVPEGAVLTIQRTAVMTVNGTLTVYGTLNVEGELRIGSEAGAVVIIDGTVNVLSNGTQNGKISIGYTDNGAQTGSVTVNGTLTVGEDAQIAVADENTLVVNGTMNLQAGSVLSSDETAPNAYMPAAGKDKAEIPAKGIVISADASVAFNGSFAGTVYILNNGNITIDNGSEENSESLTVIMGSADASVTIASYALGTGDILTITDSGMVIKNQTRDDAAIVVGTSTGYTGVDSIVFTGSANSETLNGSLTVTVAQSGNDTKGYKYSMDVAGAVSVAFNDNAGDDLADEAAPTMVIEGQKVTVSDALTLGAYVSVTNNAVMEVTGTITNTATGAKQISNGGAITVKGLITSSNQIKNTGSGVVNAAYYQITTGTPAVTTHNYSTLEAAVPAVTVEGNTATKNIKILGTVTVEADLTVPAGVTVNVTDGVKLYIGAEKDGQDVTVTMADGSKMNSKSQQVEVRGTLTFDNKTNDGTVKTVSDVTVESEERNGYKTYTNIYTALGNATAGQTVTVSKDTDVVLVNENLTIPAGVVLYVPDTAVPLYLEDGVTMTVDGTLETELDVYAQTRFGTSAMNVENGAKSSTIVVNGTVMAPTLTYGDSTGTASAITGSERTGVAMSAGAPLYGAYYETNDYNVVSNLEAALADLSDIISENVVINGPVNAGDVTFTATEDCTGIVIGTEGVTSVKDMTQPTANDIDTVLTVGSLTVVGGSVSTTYAPLNGDVVVGDARLAVSNVLGLTVTDDEEEGMVISGTSVTKVASTDVATGTVALSAGTATATLVTKENVSFAVAAGATVVSDGANLSKLVVDGIVSVASGKNLTVGEALVQGNGTVSVAANTATEASGNARITTLYLGIAQGDFKTGTDLPVATEGTATVSGPVTVVTSAYVLNGANIDATVLDAMAGSVAFNVNGAVWFTAYSNTPNATVEADKAPVENAVLAGWAETEDGEIAYGPETTPATIDWKVDVSAENVYAVIEYDIYVINLRADHNAVSSITIDGNVMNYGMIKSGDDYYYGYTAVVAAGNHTIQYQLANGYSGNGVLTVNGTQQSGLTFSTEGTPAAGQTTVTYDLQLTGFEKSGYVPDSPDTGSDSGDSGMGITDYLLIVLVVLIIVMAIIVAMRLMRS